MRRKLEELARSDLAIVAGGLLLALAAFELVGSLVENLIMPFIFLLVGRSEFPFLNFRIDNTDFTYGFVVSAVLVFAVACLLVIPLWRMNRRYEGPSGTRDCPECLSSIPVAAKRCPECTAVVTPETA